MLVRWLGRGLRRLPVDGRRYIFGLRVYANVETAATEETWSRSLDDRLIDYRRGADLDGYVGGVNWELIYPGGQVIADSERAQHWTDALGRPFHEIRLATNGTTSHWPSPTSQLSQWTPGTGPPPSARAGPTGRSPSSS